MLSMTEAKPSLLKISDKLSIRFQKTGSGPPLLLIHTIRTQLEYFRILAPLLARSHTVYAIDLPGHDGKIVHAQFLPDVAAAISAAESSADQAD